MTIENIRRWEVFLNSEVGTRLGVAAALFVIVLATAVLASLLPPLPTTVTAAESQETGGGEPIRLPVVLADAPR